MAEVISLAPFEIFMPLVAFLFVFVLVYALIKYSKVFGDNPGGISVFLSFAMAVMFIINSQLVEFVKISISWIVVFLVCIFMILLISGVAKTPEGVISGNKNVAIGLVVLVVALLIMSGSYVFNWAINWQTLQAWFDEPWFGTIAVLFLAGVISYQLTKVVAPASSGKPK